MKKIACVASGPWRAGDVRNVARAEGGKQSNLPRHHLYLAFAHALSIIAEIGLHRRPYRWPWQRQHQAQA